jgi:hypothetical protein
MSDNRWLNASDTLNGLSGKPSLVVARTPMPVRALCQGDERNGVIVI